MKKVIRLTESDLVRIVKRVINESDDLDVVQFNNGDYFLGGSSFFSGEKPKVQTRLERAKQQLQIPILQLTYDVADDLTQEEKEEWSVYLKSYIESAFFIVGDNEEDIEDLTPICQRLSDHIDNVLNKKSRKEID
jgi:hypothetical protein